jgi:hypothetical protein
MQEWIVPVALGAVTVLVLVLVVALARTRSRTRRELAAAQAEAASLRVQIDDIERRLSAHDQIDQDRSDYVITRLGDNSPDPDPEVLPARIDGQLFADIVLRETLVKAAALAHGVRRGLAPDVRNRIRFEVRREIKRARRTRRAEIREARRAWDARQRAEMTGDEDAA